MLQTAWLQTVCGSMPQYQHKNIIKHNGGGGGEGRCVCQVPQGLGHCSSLDSSAGTPNNPGLDDLRA